MTRQGNTYFGEDCHSLRPFLACFMFSLHVSDEYACRLSRVMGLEKVCCYLPTLAARGGGGGGWSGDSTG